MGIKWASPMHIVGFLVGAGVLVFCFVALWDIIAGGRRLDNLIYPPTWLYYGVVAIGVMFLWLSFPRRSTRTAVTSDAKTR